MPIKKILLVPSSYYPTIGGIEEVARNLARQFKDAGVDVRIAADRPVNSWPVRDEVEGVRVDRFEFFLPAPSRHGLLFPFKFVQTNAVLRSYLQEWQPQIIHAIGASSNALYLAAACAVVPETKIVTTTQGERFMDARGMFEKSRIHQWAVQTILDRCHAYTACSDFVLQDYAKNYRIDKSRANVIFNGVDLREFEGADGNETKQPPYVLAIGRVVENKGFQYLLRAFAKALPQLGNLELVLAGDGPYLNHLKQLAVEIGVQDRLRTTGYCDRKMTSALFRGCEFFVLPTPLEPFGIVCLEAMAAGKTLIATNAGGPPEFITDGQTGLLVIPADVDALASALIRLHGDEGRRRQMAANAGQLVQQFDWENIAAQYLTVYEKCFTD